MCGLFGLISKNELTNFDTLRFQKLVNYSERRGSDASGIVLASHAECLALKSSFGGKEFFNRVRDIYVDKIASSRVIFGHTRLSTHGDTSDGSNNQPVRWGDWVVVHNGIITNHELLKAEYQINSDLDSVVIPVLLHKKLKSSFSELDVSNTLAKLEGEISLIAFHASGFTFCYTNVGNIFLAQDKNQIWIASERIFLERIGCNDISQLEKLKVKVLGDLNTLTTNQIIEKSLPYKEESIELPSFSIGHESMEERFLEEEISNRINLKVSGQQRCKKCVLPSNFPDISFDSDGNCIYCRNSLEHFSLGESEFVKKVLEVSPKGEVLVNFSGGRDSSYALIKVKELGLNPIAFTYDWGFVTTAARENMARICGRLGVQHIVISPNINNNRKLVRSALLAWLSRPDPATIPILMSGDKPQLSTSMKVALELGGLPIVQADHYLESTGFKAALAGAKMNLSGRDGSVAYRQSFFSILKMSFRYMRLLFKTKKAFFELLTQTMTSVKIYYFSKHTFIRFFNYLDWNENTIASKLTEYNWKSNLEGSNRVWRMGDATAPFYNFLYLYHIGYTEHDALLSNMIRAGMLKREKAITNLMELNQVDWRGVNSYLNLLSLNTYDIKQLVQKREVYKHPLI
jgi:predicted glutamine amidotransferase